MDCPRTLLRLCSDCPKTSYDLFNICNKKMTTARIEPMTQCRDILVIYIYYNCQDSNTKSIPFQSKRSAICYPPFILGFIFYYHPYYSLLMMGWQDFWPWKLPFSIVEASQHTINTKSLQSVTCTNNQSGSMQHQYHCPSLPLFHSFRASLYPYYIYHSL